ncbi:hypothetical protein C444_08600 [Haloarcula japonica DSM 6131]|uniref:Uncharacterized protein n=2 Tax=Haloarcula japonica TaxID=29282 RepID=M0LG41_HALJT|nr:hypothetical protein C444_08600 [Haloarcula japonica DSM 6131]
MGNDFLYVDFVKEVSEEVTQIEEGSFKATEIPHARRMQFLLFENGTYAFESRRGVYDSDVFEYLLEDYDFQYSLSRYESLGLDAMRRFYKGSDRVKKLKADEIGQHEPNPHVTDEEIRELTEDFGQHSRSIIASVGRTKENLRNAKFIKDGVAKYSGLSMIKSVTPEGEIRKLRDSGRFDFGVDADKDEDEQAQSVRDTVSNVIRNVFDGASVDDDDD